MNLMMLALLVFIVIGLFQRPGLRTQFLVAAVVVALTSAYWLTGRV